jgi:hypothetical protein
MSRMDRLIRSGLILASCGISIYVLSLAFGALA